MDIGRYSALPVAMINTAGHSAARRAAGFLVALPLVVSSLAAQDTAIRDVVVKTDGSRVRNVEVTHFGSDNVTVKQGDKEQQIPAGEVSEVIWFQPPDAYGKAQAERDAGQMVTAANFYLEAKENTPREPLKHELQFLAGRAMLRAAEGDASQAATAEKALRAYLDEAPQGFHARDAKLAIAQALRLQGSYDQALAMLQEMETASASEGWGPLWDARIKLERGRTLAASGKYVDARSAFHGASAAAATAAGSPDATRLTAAATVAEGETFVAEKQYDDALKFFARYSSGSSGGDTVLQAAALAGEGQTLYLKTADQPDEKTLRQAQLALARAHVLDTESGNTTAKALYFSGKVLLALDALGKDKKIEEDAKTRAMSYFDTVARYYPLTSWANDARAELGK